MLGNRPNHYDTNYFDDIWEFFNNYCQINHVFVSEREDLFPKYQFTYRKGLGICNVYITKSKLLWMIWESLVMFVKNLCCECHLCSHVFKISI